MLKNQGKSSALKGERGMKEKYAMFKFIFASLACCLLAAAMITGCGGSNNPAGVGLAGLTTSTASGTATVNSSSGSIEGRVISLGGGGSVDEIPVILEQNSVVVAQTKTITSGGYYFEKLPYGIYVVRILSSASYNPAAAIVNLNSSTVTSPDLQLVSTLSLGDTPTTNITGVFSAALDGKGLSVAQLQLDSGYKTVTDAFGNFTLPNVASGQRKLDITKPGMADYSISFIVKSADAKNVSTVAYNGVNYVPAAGVVNLGNIPLNYTLANSSMITGTVMQYTKVDGKLTSTKVAVPGFNFEIWMAPDATTVPYTKIGTIVTEADGSYKLENLPPLPRTLLAVASGTAASATYKADGTLVAYILTNSTVPWNTNEFVFTSYYAVYDSKTTVMDITLPTFANW